MFAPNSSQAIDLKNCHDPELAEIFCTYRKTLRKTVLNNLDHRLFRRVDPSDILQEAFIEALKRFDRYLADKPMSVVDWLRLLTRNSTRNANAFHLNAGKRSLKSENQKEFEVRPPQGADSTPSHVVMKKELIARKEVCLQQLSEGDRQVLYLRHELKLTNGDVAVELGISEKAASKRYYRALKSLAQLMNFSS